MCGREEKKKGPGGKGKAKKATNYVEEEEEEAQKLRDVFLCVEETRKGEKRQLNPNGCTQQRPTSLSCVCTGASFIILCIAVVLCV
jgi:hypothetical protein